MLQLVADATKAESHVYAALFDLGARARVVLASGSITKREGETSAQAHNPYRPTRRD